MKVIFMNLNNQPMCWTSRFIKFCTFIISLLVFNGPVMAREFRVGVLLWSSNIPGQVAMRRGLEREAYAINRQAALNGNPVVKLIIRVAGDGTAGIENQIKQMKEMVEKRVDVIIVQPTDNAALSEPLRAA